MRKTPSANGIVWWKVDGFHPYGTGLAAVRIACFGLFLFLTVLVQAAEVLPKAPTRYFNDYAGVISQGTAQKLNSALESFEKESSSQILAVIYPKMQSEAPIEDYTVRLAQAWGVGQKDKKNGAVLFVFIQDRAMRIEVGYGLEGAIPDVTAKRIVEDEIIPHFRTQNYDAGLTAGVTALMQAAKGEYQGTGRTNAQGRQQRKSGWFPLIIFAFIILMTFSNRKRHGRMYGGRGMGGMPWIGGGGGFGGGSSGGFGGGGGFSGGGGGFGGGGASGRW
ncbi:MAG: TPM domain-containing protein [Verrucomicrobiales bacterium]